MARKKKKRIASRGSVNSAILKTLINGDKYGYEIIKEVEEYSNGNIVLKQPSLYSSLSRFEEKGYVTSYWGDSDIGGRRHYYHLTEKGFKYYQVSVLKIKDLDEDETEKKEHFEEIPIVEISDDVIPAIINFESKSNEAVPDHNFNFLKNIETKSQNVIDEKSAWKELIEKVKQNNKKTNLKKLHYKKPAKHKKVVLDSDGIYKLRDEDYIPNIHKVTKSKIVDNVGKRINHNNFYDAIYASNKNEEKKEVELTNEEKLKRNQLFEEKFNILSQSKLKPTTPPEPVKIQTSPIADKEKEVDYISKLDKFKEPSPSIETPSIEENNLFNYVDEELGNFEENDIEDKFIEFDREEFETKNENTQYIEEISNYSTSQENLKINKYENKAINNNLEDKTFVLINKVKCIFGLLLLILFMAELTISLILFKNSNMYHEGDNKVFIYAFIISIFIALTFMTPIIFNPNEHKMNTFKLKYMLILGILTFLVSLILIYCVNALMGFELDNFNYFAVRLIIPAILSFNFVIAPPIYSLLINCKKFYD